MEELTEQALDRSKILKDFFKTKAELLEATERLVQLTQENTRLQSELDEKQVVVQNLFSYISTMRS
jgi:predicted nuclease with TOPRIM domain